MYRVQLLQPCYKESMVPTSGFDRSDQKVLPLSIYHTILKYFVPFGSNSLKSLGCIVHGHAKVSEYLGLVGVNGWSELHATYMNTNEQVRYSIY
jgi:hypothetical protein